MKRILPEAEFTAEQLNSISVLARECGLCEDTVKILFGRGIRQKEDILSFLHPSAEHFISPYKMSGMKEAVELITRARDEGWGVVVYGDYDADGVCASTIMGNALKAFGIEAAVCVPERKNGYGLSVGLIDGIFEEYFPQLIITVDCGISCAEEVEYIKEQGAEVIVTDHHELPEKLPNCICINPKFSDGYPYDNLCGAGVAFKVACALLGNAAYKYLDFAAIATVADSVPLTGENRDIVFEGLKLINSSPRECYNQFFKADGEVNSQTIAFSVAPKINAAGRMGDAKSALDLFNATDQTTIINLAVKLTEYNLERQKYCDELYLSSKEMLKKEGVHGKIIVLAGENWNAGFVGIVAARLADEFSRPAILFVRHGDIYRGSARSVENVNVFEALKACGEYIEEFGGHSQAAGVNVKADRFEDFKAAISEYMSKNYSSEDFIPTVYVSGKLSNPYNAKFARELEMLEPFGVGNKRPLFLIEEGAIPARIGKPLSPHISIKSDKIDLMFFGGSRFEKLIESAAPKKFIFEYNLSRFRGKEYIKGIVRDVLYENTAGNFAGEEIALTSICALSEQPSADITPIGREEIEEALLTCPEFGTLFIANEYNAVKSYKNASRLTVDLFVPAQKNFTSTILVAPQKDIDISGFNRIIWLQNSPVCPAVFEGCKVERLNAGGAAEYIKGLSAKREDLLKIYSALSANANNVRGGSVEEAAKFNDFGCSIYQAAFALTVFEELKLISFESGYIKVYRGIKTDLALSKAYTYVRSALSEAH